MEKWDNKDKEKHQKSTGISVRIIASVSIPKKMLEQVLPGIICYNSRENKREKPMAITVRDLIDKLRLKVVYGNESLFEKEITTADISVLDLK